MSRSDTVPGQSVLVIVIEEWPVMAQEPMHSYDQEIQERAGIKIGGAFAVPGHVE